jgi:DNA repair exonuclease SbcCD ATPase subunit
MDFSELQSKYFFYQKQKQQSEDELKTAEKNLKKNQKELEHLLMARELISMEAEETQKAFQQRINSLVTMVIRSVFVEREIDFRLHIERKKNRLEVKPVLIENDIEYDDIKFDFGGSMIDLISFALRVVLWSMQKPKSRAIFILDEPFKQIGKGIMLERAGKMVRELSERLGIQIILITHEKQLQEIADKAFHVDMINGETIVK